MSNSIQTIDNYCKINKTSLEFKRDVTKPEWQKVFNACRNIEGCIQFWIGDLLKYRDQKWGMYDEVIEETGIAKNTLREYKNISESIESDVRTSDLSYSHHKQVSSLDPDKQKKFLTKAIKQNLTVRELVEEIKKDRRKGLVTSNPKQSNKLYRVIYADPPWAYDTAPLRKEVADHYPTMDFDALCDFGEEVKKISDEDCVLYMWATTGRLDWAIPVMESWGFQYKTSMIWDKIKYNMGHYCSPRHEFLLIGGKGKSKPKDPKLANSVDSVQSIEKSNKHSQKPNEFRKIIEKLYPTPKKIELFAREKVSGWDAFGNQLR